MDSLNDIWQFAPKTWNSSYEEITVNLSAGSVEYKEIEYDIKKAIKNVRRVMSISRVQNIYNFGQFLMRSQIVATENQDTQFYRVRRYVAIPTALKNIAIKYNLDHRRLEMEELEFCSHMPYVSHGYSIFVVVILTDDKKERFITPYNFTEYFIDYVVDIDINSAF